MDAAGAAGATAMSFPPPRVAFTAADLDRANTEWHCNCGPGAIAGVLGISLDQIRPFMGDFEKKGYTNPSLMWDVLDGLDVHWMRRSRKPYVWPQYGLARIQWHGRWMEPGVPQAARYRHTHWVGACSLPGNIGIFDINAVSEACPGWARLEDWTKIIVPELLKACEPGADGDWSLTHVVEIDNLNWTIPPEVRSNAR